MHDKLIGFIPTAHLCVTTETCRAVILPAVDNATAVRDAVNVCAETYAMRRLSLGFASLSKICLKIEFDNATNIYKQGWHTRNEASFHNDTLDYFSIALVYMVCSENDTRMSQVSDATVVNYAVNITV